MSHHNSKVFVIGLNKTGTTSLGKALKILGYRHICCHRIELIEDIIIQKNFDRIYEIADQYDAFEDWPWPLAYRELSQKYPDAKFILTMRKSPEVWFKSLFHHAKLYPSTKHRKLIYGFWNPKRKNKSGSKGKNRKKR